MATNKDKVVTLSNVNVTGTVKRRLTLIAAALDTSVSQLRVDLLTKYATSKEAERILKDAIN